MIQNGLLVATLEYTLNRRKDLGRLMKKWAPNRPGGPNLGSREEDDEEEE